MAKAKTKSRGTSATWVMIRGGLPFRQDDPSAPHDFDFKCNEDDLAWTDAKDQPVRDPDKDLQRFFPKQED